VIGTVFVHLLTAECQPLAVPNDLLQVFMALFVVVLAQVFSIGAAIAEEHQRIV
jgi:hypothetical protein